MKQEYSYVDTVELQKAIDFVRTKSAKQFDLDLIVSDWDKDKMDKGEICGTCCCFMGWMPELYPDKCSWRVDDDDGIVRSSIKFGLRDEQGARIDYDALAENLFGIDEDTATVLFYNEFGIIHPDLELPVDDYEFAAPVTLNEFCDMLETFIKLVGEGKINLHRIRESSYV